MAAIPDLIAQAGDKRLRRPLWRDVVSAKILIATPKEATHV
jgi:hypothetical protein